MIAFPRPDEVVVPLRRDEFDILCEGGVGEEKSRRDWYAGGAVGAFVGFLGVLAAADWTAILKLENRWWIFLAVLAILLVMTAAMGMAAFAYNSHLKRTINDSPFSRLKKRLLDLFSEPRVAGPGVEV